MGKKIYQEISSLLIAMNNCQKNNNHNWFYKHEKSIENITRDRLPCGSGIDTGTSFDFGVSTSDRLVFYASYHRMNDNGYYCNWIDFQVIVTPSLAFGFDLKIQGKFGRYQDIKEYLHETYSYCLDSEL